jgi:cyanophycinase
MHPPSTQAPSPASLSVGNSAARGTLAMIGGRFEADNRALYRALRERCNARIAVLSMASGYPGEVGEETVAEFRAEGFYAELVPIFFETREGSPFDPALVERLRAFGSVFFTGGDQSRIVRTLVQNGEATPALQCLRELYEQGGLISGSSAGAAVMSGPMLLGGTSLHAVSRGAGSGDDDYQLGQGLGFFTYGVVDQHFLQRGRIGRLLISARDCGTPFAFGVDENSALIVRDGRGEVVGETGVLFIDLRRARYNAGDALIQDARVSYLDDGDAIDLRRGKVLPAADKRRARVSRASYRRPAPVRRNAFASYALHDLMLRLVEGDPAFYHRDSASAFDAALGHQVTLEISRLPRRSRALRAVRDGEIRYSAVNFSLTLRLAALDACPLNESTRVLRPDPAPEARLLLAGSSPVNWDQSARRALLEQLVEPVGVLATASGEPAAMAQRYLDWLQREGMQAELLPIALHNIERAGRDRALLRRLERTGSLLLTGGDQRRLTEALLHCAEATPVLHRIVTAYERGVPVLAIGGAASAMGQQMIAEGDSVAALRFGSSEDASASGVVLERGIGITGFGLIDQNFIQRRRLGRLLMACAQQRVHFGFGLCEGSALVLRGSERSVEALGERGVLILELDAQQLRLAPGIADPRGIRMYLLEPGRVANLDNLAADTADTSAAGAALLERTLGDLEEDFRAAAGDRPITEQPRWGALLDIHRGGTS